MRKIIFILACFPLLLSAQDWQWQVDLSRPNSTGFQNIYLPAELTCRLNADYGNLRLFDLENDEIPYLFFSEDHVEQKVNLKWYPKVREDYWRRWYSRSYFGTAVRTSSIVWCSRSAMQMCISDFG